MNGERSKRKLNENGLVLINSKKKKKGLLNKIEIYFKRGISGGKKKDLLIK